MIGNICRVTYISWLIDSSLRLNRLHFNILLFLLIIISRALKVWIKISFSPAWYYWRIVILDKLNLNLLSCMVYCLILYIFLILNFVRMNLSYLLFNTSVWNSFIFYASFNYDFLLFKWIFYYKIFLLLVLFLFLFQILHILCNTYCFLFMRIFSPFFLSSLRLLLFFLCS